MIENLLLVKCQNVSNETLRSVSLGNAKQLVIGSTPRGDVILHVAANSSADMSNALLAFAEVSGVTDVLTLTVQKIP